MTNGDGEDLWDEAERERDRLEEGQVGAADVFDVGAHEDGNDIAHPDADQRGEQETGRGQFSCAHQRPFQPGEAEDHYEAEMRSTIEI
ncbi:MAG: hypothetical protein ACRDVD_01280 [Acidimicrobiia bacterium]